MNKELLQRTFREWKKAAGADYAITNPSRLGDCMSCVNYALLEKYGEESKGIWAKHWTSGMNKELDLSSPAVKEVYIAHDLTKEQAEKFYEVFGEHFKVAPREYNPSKCFVLYDKDEDVYELSYEYTWNGKQFPATDSLIGLKSVMLRIETLKENGVKKVTIEKL